MLTYILLRIVQAAIWCLPHWAAIKLGRSLGRTTFLLLPKKSRVVIDNISKTVVGKEMNPEEIQALAKSVFENLGVTIIETLVISKFAGCWSKYIAVEAATADEFHRLTKDGAVILLAHYNNWEIMSLVPDLFQSDKSFLSVGQTIRNKHVDKWIIARRSKFGVVFSTKDGYLKTALRLLSNKGVASLLGDQNAGNFGEQHSFLGIEASTFTTPSILSSRANVPIFYLFDSRDKDGYHQIEISKSISPDSDNIMRECLDCLEQKIIESPESWFWLHRRWKM